MANPRSLHGPRPNRQPIDGVPFDPRPVTLTAGNTLREAIEAMERTRQPGIPVLDSDGHYVGMCTVRAIADMCLPVAGVLMATMPSASFMADGASSARRRIEGRLDESVASFVDPSAPTLADGAAISSALFALFERHAVLPVVSHDGLLIGTVRWTDILLAIAQGPDTRA